MSNPTGSFGLSAATIEKIQSVFRNYSKIQKVILYGSRAKGTFKPGSDIDLSIIGESLNTNDLLKLKTELDDLSLPYQIDLSLLKDISDPNLLDHIQRVGLVFYEASSAQSG